MSPVITVKNDCNAPITLYTIGLKATGNAPKVVSNNKYTDDEWKQLNRTRTHANIALGLQDSGGAEINMWFADESAQEVVTLCDIPYQGHQKMKLHSKFGRAWDGGESYKYSMTLKIGLQQ